MKAFLFDLDFTLVRFRAGFAFWVPHFREVLVRHGIAADEREAERILTSGMINKNLSDAGIDIHAFWADFNIKDFEARRQGLLRGDIVLYEDALPLLESLRGHYLAIVSNTYSDCVALEMEVLGLARYFSRVASYTGKENPKPHPQLARAALDGRTFSDVYLVGDARADILCGKAIGAKTIHIDRLGEEVGADFRVTSLHEILPLVDSAD